MLELLIFAKFESRVDVKMISLISIFVACERLTEKREYKKIMLFFLLLKRLIKPLVIFVSY